MKDKRYQNCNQLVKLWRRRWYILIPFIWAWYSYLNDFKVFRDEINNDEYVHTDKYDVMKGKMLWSLLIGDAQSKMNWYHTHEEVMEKVKRYESN